MQTRRVDFLLIRRESIRERDREASSLRALWPRLSNVAVVELKSPGRPFRASELIRLLAYGALYHEHSYRDGQRDIGGPHELTLVLIVPRSTPSLQAEIAHMGWSLEPLEPGYARILGVMYTTYVVFTNDLAEADDDDFVRIFSEHPVRTIEAWRWLENWLLEKKTMLDPKMSKPEGYDELVQKLLDRLSPEERLRGISSEELLRRLSPEERVRGLPPEELLRRLSPEERVRDLPPEERVRGLPPEERVRGLPPEERVRGLPPEERLLGLDDEQALLALPDSVLRGLPEDYLGSLPAHVQQALRSRLARRG